MAEVTVRRLELGDYERLFVLLSQLTEAPAVGREAFEQRFQDLARSGDYVVVVAEIGGRVVATATLLIQRKFLRNCGLVGLIEDVVVDQFERGKGIGAKLVMTLTDEARARGCYKAMLNCTEKNTGFYEKCGYERNQMQMVHYF
eukprot:Plantae.Rhodophyta-Purpureofilum_apyrenoidigerum.ctg13884.p2 GENE.Plantae.Rhodophyta-Purpureofilum_apyrenoidigerum.ctg13884~~Plantae.Rhodophyta-Purpureofilum_apyrenoidigerum.ctg13884.p2  ORF type:complete len:144 (-),score=28.53 Plantae.Rhodophyta-Purpureofilum_apyrenoidigerum.ctg13884:5-436(-)